MQSKVYAISTETAQPHPQIVIYRTNGKPNNCTPRFYRATPDRLIRVLRAMVNRASRDATQVMRSGTWGHWVLEGLLSRMHEAAGAELERATLG